MARVRGGDEEAAEQLGVGRYERAIRMRASMPLTDPGRPRRLNGFGFGEGIAIWEWVPRPTPLPRLP